MKRFIGTLLTLAVICGAGFILATTIGAPFTRSTIRFFATNPVMSALVALAVLLLLISILSKNKAAKGWLPLWALGIIMVGGFSVIPQTYFNSAAQYSASNPQTKAGEADQLSYRWQAPEEVVRAAMPEDAAKSTLTSSPEDGVFSSGLTGTQSDKNAYSRAYRVNVPEYGPIRSDSDATECNLSENANLERYSILPDGNLYAHMYAAAGQDKVTLNFEEEDFFTVCENGALKLYMPATSIEYPSPFVALTVPAGVAIYDGSNGKVTYEENLNDSKYPVYPKSLNALQVESARSAGGFFEYFKQKGYINVYTERNGDRPDSFNLYNLKSQESEYVTPLMRESDQPTVTGLATVSSSGTTYGKLNPIIFNEYKKPHVTPKKAAETIRSTILVGTPAEALQIFKMTPGADGQWVASVGKEDNISYRAYVDVDGTVELHDVNGNVMKTGSSLRDADSKDKGPKPAFKKPETSQNEKDTSSEPATKDKNKVGVDAPAGGKETTESATKPTTPTATDTADTTDATGSADTANGMDFTKMSTSELKKKLEEITNEILKRAE